jgi:hypothetical protein
MQTQQKENGIWQKDLRISGTIKAWRDSNNEIAALIGDTAGTEANIVVSTCNN